MPPWHANPGARQVRQRRAAAGRATSSSIYRLGHPRVRPAARAGLAQEHGRLDDLEEALLGPGAADLGATSRRGDFEVIGSPRGAEGAGRRGLGRVRGPHAAPAVDRPGQDPQCAKTRQPDRRASPTSATPGSTPASCPISTMGYNTDRAYWEKWFPADFITECFPGQFRNWFYAILAMSTMMEQPGAVQGAARPRPGARPEGRRDAQVEGQRHPLRRRGRHRLQDQGPKDRQGRIEAAAPMGADLHALAVLPAQSRRTTSTSAPARRRSCAASSSSSCGTPTRSSATTPGSTASIPPRRRCRSKERPDIDRWILSDLQLLIQTAHEALRELQRHGASAWRRRSSSTTS